MQNQVDIRKFKSFPQLKERFRSQIPHDWFLDIKQDSCWEWLGAVTGNGYGQIGWGYEVYPAHRISYIIFTGLIPKNKIIRHTCDNPLCVNPKHLILGTQHDNLVDASKRNRHPLQKLNEETVKVIKWMLKYQYKYGLITKLAKLHKVKISTISDIRRNKTWAWVKV